MISQAKWCWGDGEYHLLNIATHKDNPVLASILSKAVVAITDAEKNRLKEKWFSSTQPQIMLHALPDSQGPVFDEFGFVFRNLAAIFLLIIAAVIMGWFIKGRPRNLKIKELVFAISFIFTGLILGSGVVVAFLLEGEEIQAQLEEKKSYAHDLAFELKRSSDDLTRMARAFASTGDPQYEQIFRQVLSIRNGEIPHPVGYEGAYWDQVIAGDIPENSEGETYNIDDRIASLGLLDHEVNMLKIAKAESDALAMIENVSMNAVKGIYQDADGLFTRRGEPDRDFARSLLYSEDYIRAKANIMRPIDHFFIMLDRRFVQQLQLVRERNHALSMVILLLTIATILFALYSFFLLKRRVIRPLSLLEGAANAIEHGDYEYALHFKQKDEMQNLAEAFASMARAIAERTRELNFQKYAMDQHTIVSATDKDGNITYVNDAFVEVIGYERDELMGKNHRIFKSGLHDDEFYETMWATIADGQVWHGELCNLTKSGGEVWLAASIVPFLDDQGKPERYISIRTNITEQKRAEADILDRQQRLTSIIQNAVDGIVVIDTEGSIQSFSPAAERMFGYQEAEVLGKNVKILMPEPHHSAHDGYLSSYYSGRKASVVDQNREVVGLHKSGRIFPMDLAVGETLIGEERIFTGIVRDITDRREAEESLQEQHRRLDDIMSNIHQGIALFDRDRKLITWNKHYPNILNIKEEQLFEGMSLFDVAYMLAERGDYGEGNPASIARDRIETMLAEETRSDLSFGGDRIFEAHSIFTSDNQLVITYTDITERKRAETIIAQSMDLIHESISYASRIQRSVLPTERQLEFAFADYGLIWEPKDVVGGDMCLFREDDRGLLALLMDCTGHGVPGAFMTMVATGALDQALIEHPKADPAQLLTRINQLVKAVLSQMEEGASGSDDGLECGIVYVQKETGAITYAGARFDLWRLRNGEIDIIKGDKVGLGYRRTHYEESFTSHHIIPDDLDQYYLFTDGIPDQVGGVRRRGFGKKRLKAQLIETASQEMTVQMEGLKSTFENYQGTEERRDDVSLLAFRVSRDDTMTFDI